MVLKMNKENLTQGDIWLFDPDPTKGNEIGKKIRPCLIISNTEWNQIRSGLVIIIPLTSVDKKVFSHVRIDPPEGGVNVPSFVMCEQLRSISRDRLVKKIGQVKSRRILAEIKKWIADLIKLGD